MDTKNVILELRTKMGLSQDELAEKVFVTRQAVSRWENGETTPNIETLKLLSKLFDVSINTLLGSPRQLICQCCGMPLADGDISRETDGFFNEEYCKWCYADGEYMYHDLDDLIEVCVRNMASEEFCAKSGCHDMDDVVDSTWGFEGNDEKFNPHSSHQDLALECGDCHKAHEKSVLMCNQCHKLNMPEGWEAPNAA